MREVNSAGRALIVRFEGVKLSRYDDGIGFATIGIGHKITPEDDIGDTITQEQCEQLFEEDLSHAAREVERLVKVDLTDNQFSALVSFVFNLGAPDFGRSTLLKLLNAGDFQGTSKQFDKWIFAGLEISNGLIARRDAEKKLFLTTEGE